MSYYDEVRRADLDMDDETLKIGGVAVTATAAQLNKTAVLENVGLTWAFHLHGTLAADGNIRFIAPVDCQLSKISAVASNNSDATLMVGISTDTDSILVATAIGDSNTPVEFDEADWAVANPTAELAAGDILVLTLDHDGAAGTAAANVTIVVTAVPV